MGGRKHLEKEGASFGEKIAGTCGKSAKNRKKDIYVPIQLSHSIAIVAVKVITTLATTTITEFGRLSPKINGPNTHLATSLTLTLTLVLAARRVRLNHEDPVGIFLREDYPAYERHASKDRHK
jgi:hypothetical protein